MRARVPVAVLALLAAALVLAQPSVVAPFSASPSQGGLPAGWAPLDFPQIAKTTRYELVADAGATVVAAAAEGSASALVHRLAAASAELRVLRWRWKAERLPEGGDTRTKAGDDAAARVYVMFRLPPERLSLPQRIVDEAARVVYGEAPPHATLMYLWDTRAPVGTRIVNAYADRVRNVVVESGPARLGQWLAYERDLAADYRAAFGDEPPPAAAIAIMTDADNTGTRAAARYGDIALTSR